MRRAACMHARTLSPWNHSMPPEGAKSGPIAQAIGDRHSRPLCSGVKPAAVVQRGCFLPHSSRLLIGTGRVWPHSPRISCQHLSLLDSAVATVMPFIPFLSSVIRTGPLLDFVSGRNDLKFKGPRCLVVLVSCRSACRGF